MASKKSPDKPKFALNDVEGKEVKIGRDSFNKREITWYRKSLNTKYADVIRSVDKKGTFIEIIQNADKMFPNPFIKAIAEAIALVSEKNGQISSEQIAEQLGVNSKDVISKMPFVRTILQSIRLKLISKLPARDPQDIKRGKELDLPVYHHLEKA